MKPKKKAKGRESSGTKQTGKVIVLTGIVTPAGWDEADSIVETLIATPDENEFLIKSDDTGKELLAYLYEKVRIEGYLVADSHKGVMVAVKRFDLINNDEISQIAGIRSRKK